MLAAQCAHTGMGLRGWRRVCETGQVLLDGRPGSPARKVRTGQCVAVCPAPAAVSGFSGSGPLRLIAQSEDLAAVFKPAGLHSARLAGGGVVNAEAMLAAPDSPVAAAPADPTFVPCLLNRLDQLTSGLLLLARSPQGRTLWLRAERAGLIDKTYLALVEGHFSGPLCIRQALDTNNRAVTRVLDREDSDPLRHTGVEPLGIVASGQARSLFPGAEPPDVTLVRCRIRMGARHQIRAHLAAAGHPLCGDSLYGGAPAAGPLLHHARLRMPEFFAFCPPPWLDALPPELASRIST